MGGFSDIIALNIATIFLISKFSDRFLVFSCDLHCYIVIVIPLLAASGDKIAFTNRRKWLGPRRS